MQLSLALLTALALLTGQSLASTTPPPSSTTTTTTSLPPKSTLTPADYSIIVFNSDCPCDRSRLKFCTLFRRQHVQYNQCYKISRPSKSMKVYHPLIGVDNRLQCQGFHNDDCSGMATPEALFTDNTMCIDFTKVVKKDTYKSFVCKHPGW